jgi:antirestriction protein ArdC
MNIETAETFFAATGAIVSHGGNRAFYSPSRDVIQLPVPEAFRDAPSYAAIKARELTHWTAHPSRLNRTLGKRFGDDAKDDRRAIFTAATHAQRALGYLVLRPGSAGGMNRRRHNLHEA